GFRRDWQLRPVDSVVARGHHLRVERHLDHHGAERPRLERKYRWIVVAEVVAPPEWVVDTTSVETRNVSFEVAYMTNEQVDFGLRLAAVLPGQHAAGWDTDFVEAERVRSDRRAEFMALPDRVEVPGRLVRPHRR